MAPDSMAEASVEITCRAQLAFDTGELEPLMVILTGLVTCPAMTKSGTIALLSTKIQKLVTSCAGTCANCLQLEMQPFVLLQGYQNVRHDLCMCDIEDEHGPAAFHVGH